MTTSALYAPEATKTRPAVVVTRNPAVYRDVTRTMTRIGATRVMHMSPQQLLEVPHDVFWVVDARTPGAMELIAALLAAGRTDGLVLSSPSMSTLNKLCVKSGVPALLMHSLVESTAGTDPPLHLSAREIEIVRLISMGRSNDEIGELLGISGLTVKSHVARMLRKTSASDRSHLVLLALRAGLIE